jgi:tetratricopeptide (TPR) repeat protein/tRNA A-37 threonylcarbamoyl transferase component Bud32
VARCATCHRRLASGKACPAHGGEVAPIAETKIEPGERPAWIADGATCIGRGGYASVWTMESIEGVECVLKIAHANHELARARIAREADALAAIDAIHETQPHRPRAVPKLFDRGVTDGRGWMVMERVRGENLADATLGGPLRADHAVKITLAILDAVEHVHLAGFAHRDLKPDNLIRKASGEVVVLDLGIARKLPDDPDDPTRAGVQIGSLEYMPPEQAVDAASVDARSDLYAVGCILFELCTGRPPFVGDVAALERAHAALRPPRLSELAPVPQVLEAIVHDVLAKDPAKRPSSAAELRAKLLATRDTPSLARSIPTLSQVTESKQPVVLVWAELPKVDRALLGQFSARHVIVVSQRGRKILGALLGSTHGDPSSAALALARDLAASGARVACHLDALGIDTSGPAPVPRGEAIDRVESWLPAEAWTGVILTRALAAVTQVSTRPSPIGDAFRQLASGDAPDVVELVGRGALLVDLAADAAAALRGAPSQLEKSASGSWTPMGPELALLYGDAGTGKTVFAAELGRRIADLGARVHVAAVPAPGMAKRGALEEIVGAIRGVREIGDALRAHARHMPLAILLDDLHFADTELLDALEYATLGGESLPLWVLGIADPRLEIRRPQLGARAERRRRDVLPLLDEEAAVELTTRLLKPAEYPPLRAVRQLVALARGNPLHLTMLAREIHERGAIRRRPGSSEFFLDTTALDSLEPIALGPWIAARAIAGLALELVALARACAVIGGPFATTELVSVIDGVERAGGPTTTIDPEVGMKELIAAQILVVAADGSLAFRQALVEEGLYATTDDVAKRAFHAAALAHEQAEGGDPARIARHAEAVGESVSAGAAFALLGVQAEHEYHPLEAEHAWAGAVRHLVRRDEPRARALLGLARARMRLQRLLDASAVLDEALAIAREIGDARLEVELALEQAIVRDFCEDFDGARANVELARDRLATFSKDANDGLAIDLAMALGRDQFRRQRYEEAATTFIDVLSRARAMDRHETATIAALLLGPALSDLGRLDEAERVFDQLIADCRAHDDRFHLAAAYGNRAWLWSAKGEIDRTADDLRHASQLARESGQAVVERSVVHNLSEQMLWEGKLDEALQLARRGLSLQSRAAEGGTGLDRLLLARVLAARGEVVELREVLATFSGETLGDNDLAGAKTLEVLRALASSGSADVWEKALDGTEPVFVQLRLELWLLAARHGRLSDTRTVIARELAAADPLWKRRIHEL